MIKNILRNTALLLVILLLAALLPTPTACAADEDLSAIVEEQIRTYAESIDQENASDGSNMIWLTVRDNTLDEEVLCAPLDDHTAKATWEDEFVLQDESSDWVSGKDIYINYFGNKDLRFLLDCFDLKIWENGEGGESCDYFETTIVAPTCTEGYTLHTCAACGYSYKTDFVPANPHTYSSKVTPPTCTGEGYTTYTCTACSHSYKADPVPAVGHEYTTEVTPPTCTEKGYTTYTCTVCGETHTDDEVNALNHSYSAGYCARCGSDTVTASIADGQVNVRATRGIKTGTWVLVAGYAADGRMVGFRIHPWEGSPQTLQTIDLPAGETFILYFIKGSTWTPLRTPVIPQ